MNITKLTLDEQMTCMETVLKKITTFTHSKYIPDFMKEVYSPLNFLATDPHADE